MIELLKTNGNCTGKCIAGISPNNMTVQDAVNTMSQWGMVTIGENSLGQTFVNLETTPVYGQLTAYLSIGTWAKELETIDRVALRIQGADSYFVKKDVWIENQEMFLGFRMDSLLRTYGIPSYVGYDFSSVSPAWTPDKGENIEYAMSLHFEQFDLHILISGIAYYDGETIFLCPSKESHTLGLEINPERPLTELEKIFPVTWQSLTGTDLNAFYREFAGENSFDVCATTSLEKILALQP